MSWSMLHKGDMSSNVLENFTTYMRDTCDHNQHLATKTGGVLHKKGYVVWQRSNFGRWTGNESVRHLNLILDKEPEVSQVSRCLRGGAQSSVRTAGGSALAAWSSWQSFPGQSAPQTGRWPPPAEPVAARRDTNDLCSPHSVDIMIQYNVLLLKDEVEGFC